MASTFTLIESFTVGAGGASAITIGSGNTIPQTYTDLKLMYSLRVSASTGYYYEHPILSFNGGGGTYKTRMIYSNGGSALSADDSGGASTVGYWAGITTTSNTTANAFANNELYIPNYTESRPKPYAVDGAGENAIVQNGMCLTSGFWTSSAAITSITLTASVGSFVQYSSVYLYGIKNS